MTAVLAIKAWAFPLEFSLIRRSHTHLLKFSARIAASPLLLQMIMLAVISTTHASCSMKCLREMWLLGTQWSQAIPNMVTFKAHVHSSIPCLWGTLHPDPLWLPARWPTAGGTKALQYFEKWWWMGHSDLLVWWWQHWSLGVRTWVLFVC